MIRPSIARKYAKALVAVAHAKGQLARVVEEVFSIKTAAEVDPALRTFLESPAYPESAKKAVITAILDRACPEGIDPLTRNFFEALALHHRLPDYFGIMEALRGTVDEQEGVIKARVTTATPASDEEREAVASALSQATSRRIRLELEVNEGLIAGAVTQIGSTIYDGSLRTRLLRLKESIVKGRVTP